MADDEKVMKILKGKLVESAPAKKPSGELVKGVKKDGTEWQIFNLQMLIDGKTKKIGSFNASHKELVNHYVKMQVEVKQDGKYTNYTLKKIEELEEEESEKIEENDGEGIIDNEEEIVDDEESTGGNDITEKEGRKMDSSTPEGKKKAKKIMEEVKGTDWIAKEKRSIRGMCVSYAKDMVIADKIKKEELIDTAQIMFEYTWGGVTK